MGYATNGILLVMEENSAYELVNTLQSEPFMCIDNSTSIYQRTKKMIIEQHFDLTIKFKLYNNKKLSEIY